MKWFVRIGGGLLLLVVLAVLAAPLLIDKESLIAKAEEQATATLGRKVEIGAVTGVSVFPPRLTVQGLKVANAEGFSAPYLARVDEARLGVRLMPLISRRVEIERFILDEPEINLEAREDGTNNYTLGQVTASKESTRDDDAAPNEVAAPVVGTIEIASGAVRYESGSAGYEASDVDAVLVLPPLGRPLTLESAMDLEGVPASINLEVAQPWVMAEKRPSAVKLSAQLAENRLEGSFEAVPEPLRLSGDLSLEAGDLAALSPLIGSEMVEAAKPFGSVSVTGSAEVTETTIAFEDARYETALGSGEGRLSLDISGEKPSLTGNLSAGTTDLRPLFPEAMQETGDAAGEDEGFPAWSEEPVDLSGLTAADAEVDILAEEILLPTYALSGVRAKARLKDGDAVLTLDNAEALGGRATGTTRLRAGSGRPRIESAMTFASVVFAEAGPALLASNRLFGEGTLRFDLETEGESQRAWVEALSGNVGLNIEDGRILGIDLSALASAAIQVTENIKARQDVVQALGSALNASTADALGPEAKTEFDLANFAATISSGRTDLGQARIMSDTLRATIGGSVNLPAQSVDMRILLAAKAPEASSFREFKAPVAVTGTFSQPKIAIDPKPIANELARGAVSDALGKAGVNVEEGQSVRDAVKERATSEIFDLLGGRKKKEGAAQKEEQPQDEPAAEEPPR